DGMGRRVDPADAAVVRGEPEIPVGPGHDPEGVTVGPGDAELGDHTRGSDLTDLVAGPFGEPEVAVGPDGDLLRAAIGRGDGELIDGDRQHAARLQALDLEPYSRPSGSHRGGPEPRSQIPIWPPDPQHAKVHDHDSSTREEHRSDPERGGRNP